MSNTGLLVDTEGRIAGRVQNGRLVGDSDPLVRGWFANGVPGLMGVQRGDVIVEHEVVIAPDDPFFLLAVMEYAERLEWQVVEESDEHDSQWADQQVAKSASAVVNRADHRSQAMMEVMQTIRNQNDLMLGVVKSFGNADQMPHQIIVNVPEQRPADVIVNVPTPIVNVAAPVVNVPETKVTVEPAQVTVNVPETVVNVPAPVVNVEQPDIYVRVDAPEVTVAAPTVNVEAPVVNVSPEVKIPETTETIKLLRDAKGNTVGAERTKRLAS